MFFSISTVLEKRQETKHDMFVSEQSSNDNIQMSSDYRTVSHKSVHVPAIVQQSNTMHSHPLMSWESTHTQLDSAPHSPQVVISRIKPWSNRESRPSESWKIWKRPSSKGSTEKNH